MTTEVKRSFLSCVEAGFGLLILGFILVNFGCAKEWEIISHSGAQPQSITAAKLAADGPGSNWYVHISDFAMVEPIVSLAKQSLSMGESLQSVSCKLVPQPVSPPDAKDLIIVKSAKTKAEIEDFLHQPTVDAIAEPGNNGIIKLTARKPRAMSEFLFLLALPAAACIIAGAALVVIGLLRNKKLSSDSLKS